MAKLIKIEKPEKPTLFLDTNCLFTSNELDEDLAKEFSYVKSFFTENMAAGGYRSMSVTFSPKLLRHLTTLFDLVVYFKSYREDIVEDLEKYYYEKLEDNNIPHQILQGMTYSALDNATKIDKYLIDSGWPDFAICSTIFNSDYLDLIKMHRMSGETRSRMIVTGTRGFVPDDVTVLEKFARNRACDLIEDEDETKELFDKISEDYWERMDQFGYM